MSKNANTAIRAEFFIELRACWLCLTYHYSLVEWLTDLLEKVNSLRVNFTSLYWNGSQLGFRNELLTPQNADLAQVSFKSHIRITQGCAVKIIFRWCVGGHVWSILLSLAYFPKDKPESLHERGTVAIKKSCFWHLMPFEWRSEQKNAAWEGAAKENGK